MIIESILLFLASIVPYNVETQQPKNENTPKIEIKVYEETNNNTLLRGGWDGN